MPRRRRCPTTLALRARVPAAATTGDSLLGFLRARADHGRRSASTLAVLRATLAIERGGDRCAGCIDVRSPPAQKRARDHRFARRSRASFLRSLVAACGTRSTSACDPERDRRTRSARSPTAHPGLRVPGHVSTDSSSHVRADHRPADRRCRRADDAPVESPRAFGERRSGGRSGRV